MQYAQQYAETTLLKPARGERQALAHRLGALVDELRATDAAEVVQHARREAALADFDQAVKGIEYAQAHRRAVLAHLEVAVVEARTRLITAG